MKENKIINWSDYGRWLLTLILLGFIWKGNMIAIKLLLTLITIGMEINFLTTR